MNETLVPLMRLDLHLIGPRRIPESSKSDIGTHISLTFRGYLPQTNP